jgi:succinate dehydrogenase / fumarate reductase, cytochrome b subunit
MATTMERRPTAPIHPRPHRRGPWPVQFYRSAVGKKWVMAITGILLMAYVFAHAIGNLKVYLGAAEVNHYGEFLRELLVPILPRTVTLWLMRIGLTLAFVFHIHAAYGLTRMNRRSNAGGYQQKRDWQAASIASRTMRWTGVIVLLFVLFHLADLTWGNANPDFVRGDIYRNMVASFERIPVAIIYIVANIALALHLFHGSWSMFQSLGLNNPRWNSWRKGFAVGFSVLILVLNLSFPIAVLTGVVSADDNDDCIVQNGRIVSCELYDDLQRESEIQTA